MSLLLSSLILLSTPSVSCQETKPRKPQASDPDAVFGVHNPLLALTYGEDDRVAARLMQLKWDPKNPRPTCKVFHHVYAPDGALLTKGFGGQFEHHRGLFVGWNRTLVGKKRYDFWHCNKGERQEFTGVYAPALLGLKDGAQVSIMAWNDPDGRQIVHELRGLEVLAHDDDSYALLMRVQCQATVDLTFTGDPQHAGQQFRSLQQFAEKDADPVLYMRPEGAKDHGNDVWTGCDWIAGVLRLPKKTYTVLRIESPHNGGKKIRWSTRPYGRFGATRTMELKKGERMRIDQIYVIANGAQDGKWCADQAAKWRKSKRLAPPKPK